MLYGALTFFFFKQKTAYEMRISDWSSDVCSSDLQRGKSSMDRSVVCRFHAVRLDNVGKRRFDHFDFHALSDFHVHIIVIDPNHLTHKTAARDDLVALLHGFDSGAMLLHFLLLRTNEKKVEDHEYQKQRKKLDDKASTAGSGRSAGLGKGRSGKHGEDSRFLKGAQNYDEFAP